MSERRGGSPIGHRRTITAPEPSAHLSQLSLQELRDYRAQLTREEERASYWRRLAHARIDLLRAQSTAGSLSLEDLVHVLGDTGSGSTRKALLNVIPAEPLPELPQLSAAWSAPVDPNDPAALDSTLEGLVAAADQLSDYRRALHARIEEATGELIVRYRADPTSALVALPGV